MVVQYNKENNKWSGLIIDIYKAKKGIVDVSNEATRLFEKYNKNGKDLSKSVSNSLSQKGGFDTFIEQNNLADESLIKFLKDTNYATKDLANYQQYLKNTGNKISNFSAFTNKAGSILKSFGTSLASIGANMAIGMGIEALFSAIDQAANRVEYAKQRADEFTNVAKSQKEEFNQNTSKIAELNEQYQTLSKGVNNAGENISLTTEEYKTYKDVVSQISNIIPDLNTYYNDQGEKIGFVTGELKNLNKEYDKYKMKEALKTINGEGEDGVSLSDVIDNFNAQKDTDGWSDFVNAPKSFITGNDYDDLYSNEDLLISLKELKNLSKDDVADKLGYARSTYLDFLSKFLSGGTEGGPDGKTTDKMRALQDILGYNKSDFEDMTEEEYGVFKDKLDAVIQSYEGKLDAATDGLSEGLQKVAASRPEYYALGDKKQYVDTLLSNITYDMADNIGLTDEDGKMTEESVRVFVNRMIESVKDNKSGVNTAFQSLFELDIDSMNPLEAKEKVDTYINQIASVLYGDKVNSNQINGLKLLYGFGDVADDATTYSSKLKNFYSKDNNSNSQETIENWSKNSNVTDEELESLKDKGYNAKSSIDELNIALNELRNDSKKELVPKDFSTVWDSLGSDSKDTLLNTANSCELTGDKIKELAKSNKNLDAAFKASGMSADEFARSVREANIDNLDNDIDVYENALQKMRDGKSLSTEETAAIISKDNSLANSVTKTKDGYKIEESALLSVINASKEKYNVVVANEILQTETVIKNTKKRIRAYNAELESAQAAITTRQSEYESLINSGEYAGKEDEVSRAILGNPQAVDDYAASQKLPKKIKKEKKRLKKLNKELQKLQKSLGKVSNSSTSPSGTKPKETKQTFDWIERRLSNLQRVIDLTAAKFQNIFKIDGKKKNLDKQIKTTKKLMNEYGIAAQKYQKKANQVAAGKKVKNKKGKKKVKGKLSKSIIKKITTGKLTKKTKLSALTDAYGSDKAQQIQSYIDYYDKAQSAKKSKEEQRTKLHETKKAKLQLDVDDFNAKATLADTNSGNAIGAKSKNAFLSKEIKFLNQSYAKQIAIAKLEENSTEMARLKAEQEAKIVDLKQQQIDNIKKDYENKIGLIDNKRQHTQNEISLLEAKGRIVTANYYRNQNDHEINKRNTLQNELKELQGKLNSRTFEKGSDEWYQLQSDIQSVENSINECNVNIVENSKKLGELHNAMLEDIAANNTRMSSEADFLAGLMGSVLTDEKGNGLTKEGMGVLGTYGIGVEAAEKNAKDSADERKRLENLLSSHSYGRTNDEYQSEKSLRNAISEVAQKQQEYTKTAYDYETKIADLMKENYQAQLDYMKKIIDAKKNVLSLEKDLYDYERNISDQTKNIAALEKQYAALQGDDSEEGRAKRSSLQASIDEARQELQDTEYDKYISDQQNMLDNLYTEYEDLMNNLFKDQNQLLKDGIEAINKNGTTIKGVIDSYADSYGYNYTEDFSSVMTALGSEGTIVTSMKGAINGDDSSAISQVLKDQADRIIQAYGEPKTPPTNMPTDEQDTYALNQKEAAKHKNNSGTTGKTFKLGSNGNSSVATKSVYSTLTTGGTDANLAYGVNQFIRLHGKKPAKGHTYKPLNKAINKEFGVVLTTENLKKLAKKVGVKFNGSEKSDNLYKKLKAIGVQGFKHGGIAKLVKSQGEDGLAMVRNGEGLISPENVAELQKFVKVIPTATDLLNNMKDIPIMPNLPTPSNTFGDIHFDKIELPNVQDVDDFVTALQTDKKVQRALGVSVHDLMTKGRITSNIQKL